MSFPGVPQYTESEDTKLRYFYPSHSKSSVIRALRGRSWRSICMRAHYLQIARKQEARRLETQRFDRSLIDGFTKSELAYVAGLMDGEGCICFSKTKTPKGTLVFTLQVSISNTSLAFKKWFNEKLPGRLYGKTYPPKPGTNVKATRTCFSWIIAGNNLCQIFLKAVLPYLVIKRKQAELMSKGYLHLSESERVELWKKMRYLKRNS